MARDATIILENLECVSQSQFDPSAPFADGQSPYLWPVVVWLDDQGFGGTSLFLGESRLFLHPGMRPGDTAVIPYPLGTLGHRFEDSSGFSQLLLAVLVWVGHASPCDAVWAGCKAFADALPTAVAANLNGLLNPATRAPTIEVIKQVVSDKVESAITDALTWLQQIASGSGLLTLDAVVGADFFAPADLTPADFTLSMSDTSGTSYAVHGGLRVHSPVVDVCQDQVDQVTDKQKALDAIADQLVTLQLELQNAPTSAKAALAAQIKLGGKDYAIADRHLTDAQTALRECRAHWMKVVGALPTAPGTPIATAP